MGRLFKYVNKTFYEFGVSFSCSHFWQDSFVKRKYFYDFFFICKQSVVIHLNSVIVVESLIALRTLHFVQHFTFCTFGFPKISLFAPFVSDSTLACYPSGVKEQSGTARVSHLQEKLGYTARWWEGRGHFRQFLNC